MRASAVIALLALVASVGGGAAGGDARPLRPALLEGAALRLVTAVSRQRASRLSWHGGRMTAATGEQVTIEVSDSYSPEAVSPQAWADFFAGLLHGDELARVTVRIATPAEVGELCGPYASGCYAGGLLVMPGETWAGVTPEEVARHEYGHHVALNRSNPPWQAVDWGPKRWSSRVNVCSLTAAAELFPGDEGRFYRLNPGEGFAEAYRVLNERRSGVATFTWSVVDGRFIPDEGALEAIELDVVRPWTAPTVRTVRARFRTAGRSRWRLGLRTPLDGVLTAAITLPAGRLDSLELVSDDGKVLAQGLWADARTKRLTYEVCGRRKLELRVTLRGRPGPFSLSVAQP